MPVIDLEQQQPAAAESDLYASRVVWLAMSLISASSQLAL